MPFDRQQIHVFAVFFVISRAGGKLSTIAIFALCSVKAQHSFHFFLVNGQERSDAVSFVIFFHQYIPVEQNNRKKLFAKRLVFCSFIALR